jgi:hypothetical protein
METLRELARIVTPRYPKRLEIASQADVQGEGLFGKLYKGVSDGSISTDFEGVQDLYGTQQANGPFRALKSRLRKKLLNVLFFIEFDIETDPERPRMLHELGRDLFLVRTLIVLGARTLGVKIAENALEMAEKYEATAFSLEIQQQLRSHYARQGNKRLFLQYSEAAHRSMKLLDAEMMAAEAYERIAVEFAYSTRPRPDLAEIAHRSVRALDRLKATYPSFDIHLNYFRLSNFATQVVGNYESTIGTSEEACKFLKARPHLTSPGRIGEFLIDELESCVFLRRYAQGERIAEECREHLGEGKNNWFIFMETYFLLAMHTRHFEKALEIFLTVSEQPRLAVQPEQRREKWRIFELYVRYLFPEVPIKKSLMYPGKRTFSLRNFMKQVPTYARDKQGFNIAILIAQILYLVDRKEFAQVIDRVEALRTYRSRYLGSDTHRQSSLFLRMLMRAVAKSFDRIATIEACAKFQKELLGSIANYNEITDTIQILPLDWVWEKIVSGLPD